MPVPLTTACLFFAFVLQLGPQGADIASYVIGGLGLLNQALVEIAAASSAAKEPDDV